MPTYRENLLSQAAPLEAYELRDLEDWLAVLRKDVDDFGETPEDVERMGLIEARIAAETAEHGLCP
jgi:hypothetical protein